MKKRLVALFIVLVILFSFSTAAYAGDGTSSAPPPLIQTSAPIIINISPPICY